MMIFSADSSSVSMRLCDLDANLDLFEVAPIKYVILFVCSLHTAHGVEFGYMINVDFCR